jgi:lichenan operon transcriptional antiterminator
MISLSTRQKKILDILSSSADVVSGSVLADKLRVSTRTLRTEVTHINDALARSGIQILSYYGRGYGLQNDNRRLFSQLMASMDKAVSRDDRIHYILLQLIDTDDSVDLCDIEDELYISRSTLESDLKIIQEKVCKNEPYINLKIHKNTLIMEDDELKKRNILLHLFLEMWDFNSLQGIQDNPWLEGIEYLEPIHQVLQSVLHKSGILLDEFQFAYLTLSVLLIYTRNLQNHHLYEGNLNDSIVLELARAKKILDQIPLFTKMKPYDGDYAWFAESLSVFHHCNNALTDSELTEEEVQLTDNLLRDLKAEYGLDFSGDQIFYRQLCCEIRKYRFHMVALTSNMRFYYQDIEKKYPFLGDIDRYLEWKLEGIFHYKSRMEEMGHMIPILAAAWVRRTDTDQRQMTALLVTGLDTTMAAYLMESISLMFGDRMKLIGWVTPHDIKKAAEMRPSMILTTLADTKTWYESSSVVTLAPVLRPKDIQKINSALEEVELTIRFPKLAYPLESYFPNELRVQKMQGKDIRSLLIEMADLLVKKGYIHHMMDEKQMRYGFPQEDMLFCYFLDGSVPQTVFLDYTLDKEVPWINRKLIRRIVFASISPKDSRFIGSFYCQLSKLN